MLCIVCTRFYYSFQFIGTRTQNVSTVHIFFEITITVDPTHKTMNIIVFDLMEKNSAFSKFVIWYKVYKNNVNYKVAEHISQNCYRVISFLNDNKKIIN